MDCCKNFVCSWFYLLWTGWTTENFESTLNELSILSLAVGKIRVGVWWWDQDARCYYYRFLELVKRREGRTAFSLANKVANSSPKDSALSENLDTKGTAVPISACLCSAAMKRSCRACSLRDEQEEFRGNRAHLINHLKRLGLLPFPLMMKDAARPACTCITSILHPLMECILHSNGL